MRSHEGSRPFEAIRNWIFPEKIWMRFSLWVVKTNFCFIKISTCLDQEINLNFLAKEILFIIKIAIRIMHSYLPNVPRGELSTWNFINTDSPYSRFYCQNPPARKVSYSTARWSSTELPISKTQYIQLSPGSAKVYNLIFRKSLFWSYLKLFIKGKVCFRMFSQTNTLRCKLIYTFVKSKKLFMQYQGNRPTGDRTGNYSVVQQKIHFSSRTNYTTNLYSALICLCRN